MAFQHQALASGRWHTMSLSEQMGNIGSEVHRARLAENTNEQRFINARDRALELFAFTLADARWRGRLREIARVHEIFCDAVLGGKEYSSRLEDLEKYFDQFAFAARKDF